MRLVDNAWSAWRWLSVQFAALGVALEAAWRFLPPDLTSNVPDGVQSTITLLIFSSVLVGRLIDQGGKDGAD